MRITTEEQLRKVVEHPHPTMRDKPIAVIDEQSARFLAASTFFLFATTGADGTVDVSPRGEVPGGIRVLDDTHLAFGDRPGNRRLDSLRNILQNPQVGLLFAIPGKIETIRVNGRAELHTDPPFADAPLGVIVEVEELFLHCGQSLRRAGAWEPERWPAPESVPSTGELVRSAAEVRERLGPARRPATDPGSATAGWSRVPAS